MADEEIVTRHGESEQNLVNRALREENWPLYWELRGKYTNPHQCKLTPKGENQARTLRPIIRKLLEHREREVIVLHSPYTRAIQTMEIVLDGWFKGRVIEEYRLRERDWGAIEQKTHTPQTYEGYYRRVVETLHMFGTFTPPGGESMYTRFLELEAFRQEIRQNYPEAIIWMPSHGEILRALQMIHLGLTARSWHEFRGYPHNCHTEAWSRQCPETGTIYDRPRWRSLVYCPQTKPEGGLAWDPL